MSQCYEEKWERHVTVLAKKKTSDSPDHLALDVVEREVFESLKHDWDTIGQPCNKELKPGTINRVLHSDRSADEKSYTPKMIAIGPYHHNNDTLKPGEEMKRIFLRSLVDRNEEVNKLEKYIGKHRDEVQSFYPDMEIEDIKDFIQMIVLDGCFLIEFLVRWYLNDLRRWPIENALKIKRLSLDLVLVENQLPFVVLQWLFNASDIPQLRRFLGSPITIMNLIVNFITTGLFDSLPSLPEEKMSSKEVYHILHAYHRFLCLPPITGSSTQGKYKNIVSKCFASLLVCKDKEEEEEEEETSVPISIPSATQLLDAGIKLRMKHFGTSMSDVTFHRKSGILEIPVIVVEMTSFRNMVIFEHFLPQDTECHFIAYATLLTNLINTAADVSVFKENHIIDNGYGNNEEVAVFFNHICDSSLFLHNKCQRYKKLIVDVNDYCRIKRHRWTTVFVRTYFASPWSLISLIAAFILLALTILQTFYTVFPYYHPRN